MHDMRIGFFVAVIKIDDVMTDEGFRQIYPADSVRYIYATANSGV